MQQDAGSRVSSCVKPNDPGDVAAVCLPGATRALHETGDSAEVAVSTLYQASAVSLIRLAWIMLGDRPSAEDVVQEAFCDLYRRWDRLAEADSALYYVRSSVLNGCRSLLRRRAVRRRNMEYGLPEISPEAVVLNGEERVESECVCRERPGLRPRRDHRLRSRDEYPLVLVGLWAHLTGHVRGRVAAHRDAIPRPAR